MHDGNYFLLELSVDDVYSYIFSFVTSQHVSMCAEKIYQINEHALTVCTQALSLTQKEEPGSDASWFIVLEKSLGLLKLVLPEKTLAQEILAQVSLWVIEECPSMTLEGTSVACEWTPESISAAHAECVRILHEKALKRLRPPRNVWSFCRVSPRDGLPASWLDERGHAYSVNAQIKTDTALQELIQGRKKAFANALRANEQLSAILPESCHLNWETDPDQLMKASYGKKFALVSLRVNTLPQLIPALKDAKKKKLNELIKAHQAANQAIRGATEQALLSAIKVSIAEDLRLTKGPLTEYTMPLQLIVPQAFELLFFMRSDLVFTFIDAYAAVFEAQIKKAGGTNTLSMGMVIMNTRYPFSKALKLCNQLLENATASSRAETPPASKVDYLIVTNDVEQNIHTMRKQSYIARDGSRLTAKPFVVGRARQPQSAQPYRPDASLADILADARFIASQLPTSFLRSAIDDCHQGTSYAKRTWEQLHNNLLLDDTDGQKRVRSFERIFNTNFFIEEKGAQPYTLLGDYLELRHLFAPAEN